MLANQTSKEVTTVSASEEYEMMATNATPLNTSLVANGVPLEIFLATDAVIAMITCIGNGILLAAFAKDPKLRARNKSMSTLIINLAVSDFFHGAMAIPWFIIPHYANPYLKSSSVTVCVLSFLLFQYSTAVSLLTTLAIAIERFIAVRYPLWAPRYVCVRVTGKPLVLVFTWLYPAVGLTLITAPHVLNQTWEWCEMSVVLSKNHLAIIGAHLFIILVLATVLYVKMLSIVHASGRRVRRYSKSSEYTTRIATTNCRQRIASRQLAGPPLLPQMSQNHNVDMRIIKTLILLMAIFYLSFIPTIVKAIIFLGMGRPSPEPLWLNIFDQAVMTCLMIAPCLDPLIYSWRKKQLRQTIISMLLCKLRRQSESSSTGPSSANASGTVVTSSDNSQKKEATSAV